MRIEFSKVVDQRLSGLLAYSITAFGIKCVGLVGLLGEPDRPTFGDVFHFSTRGHEKRPDVAGLQERSIDMVMEVIY